MYDKDDPRSTLAPSKPVATTFAAAEYARFYADTPQQADASGKYWYARGQNFVLVYIEANAGAVFRRADQPDEYVVLVPEARTSVEIHCQGQVTTVPGYSVAFVPPGASEFRVSTPGPLVLMFTSRSADLCALCANAAAYALPHPNIPPFEPWPEPAGGLRLRQYSLDVPEEPGRFGRIWRCTTFMVNFLPEHTGPRDVSKLSPHHHDSFEQGSLALAGAFTHHIRWPWTPDLNAWRADEHELCESPSLAVIPPPAIHTSHGVAAGINQLVDVFSPPRLDFSQKPGWVLNAADYPAPGV